jgi:putative sigma-54 modulation protein
MQIAITFRHVDSNEEVKKYAREKLQRLEKYVDAPIDLQMTVTQEKHRHRVEAILKANNLSINGQEETSDFFASIDAVVDNLERQLKKRREKVQNKHKGSNEDRLWGFRMDVISAQGQDQGAEPQIIVSQNLFAKPMSLEEAVMQMKITENEFIVFMDSATEKINVLYRRKDGNYGLIEPEMR